MVEQRRLPLFETTRAKGRVLYRLFAVSIFVGICFIWVYRVTHLPKAGEDGRVGWMALSAAELWFGFYWFITQASRWKPIYRHTFKDRLSQRYEKVLPGVDIFVCTADPIIEPPMMVMNTVLSVMAYDYPPEKLSVYLSDDGGSLLTYYALLEAAEFSKHWIPFCKKYSVEPRSPAAYFVSTASGELSQSQAEDFAHIKEVLSGVDIFVYTGDPIIEPPMMVMNTVLSAMAYDYQQEKLSTYLSDDGGSKLTYYAILEATDFSKHWIPFCNKYNVDPRSPTTYFVSTTSSVLRQSQAGDFAHIKKLYEDTGNKVKNAVKLGRVSEEVRSKHKGFSQWDSYSSKRDHDTIFQIVIDGKDRNARDVEGCVLPTLVYLAREKRPQFHHNYKAGAMNALIRVSSNISNGKLLLNVDCDMYSNNSMAIRDALCFLMDEEQGHEIAFVQFPQKFANVTKNEVYSSTLRVINEVELHGLDGYGGPLYIGTGCFHRRDTLCGRKFSKGCKSEMKWENSRKGKEVSIATLEETSKGLASCTVEENTQWGKEMGLKYGCPVEDVITGLSIQCRGWKSVYCNPKREAFLGLAPTTLPQTLVQHKRWSEGDFQIFVSKYNPALYGYGKISLGLQLGYYCYLLWAANSLATLVYSILPSLYLLRGISLFPQVSSLWFIPFAYVMIAKYTWSFGEFLWSGGTILGWWNDQRIWLYKRTSSYLFGFIDTILFCLGYSNSAFVITAKMSDEDVSQRYKKEIMEFGASSPMFVVLSTIALLNLYCFADFLKEAITKNGIVEAYETMALQILLCGVLIIINLPLYQALYLRNDNGKMPSSVAYKSMAVAAFSCICYKFLY